jgi:hypothetical protein
MKLTRRDFAKLLGVGGTALSIASLVSDAQAQTPEPKSIHTWLDSDKKQIYAYDLDVKVTDFPKNPDRAWLYYLALQVNFTDHNEWSHGGIQWSGTKEFKENNNKGVNWGGGSDWSGYGGLGVNNTPFTWETGRWYRYRVWRPKKEKDGLYRWLFAVKDVASGIEKQYGTIKTKSEWIKNAVAFTETGYGVKCNTERIRVEWRNPVIRCTTPGEFSPTKGTANYNGTCRGNISTDQGLISKDPIHWFHMTNAKRKVNPDTRLWG